MVPRPSRQLPSPHHHSSWRASSSSLFEQCTLMYASRLHMHSPQDQVHNRCSSCHHHFCTASSYTCCSARCLGCGTTLCSRTFSDDDSSDVVLYNNASGCLQTTTYLRLQLRLHLIVQHECMLQTCVAYPLQSDRMKRYAGCEAGAAKAMAISGYGAGPAAQGAGGAGTRYPHPCSPPAGRERPPHRSAWL